MKTKGFTILEIMLATLIVAIIAAFAIPDYKKARELAIERDAIKQLKLINTAQLAFYNRNGFYMPSTTNVNPETNILEINNALGLNIIYNGKIDFVSLQFGGGSSYQTQAVNAPNYMIVLDGQLPWNPQYNGAVSPNRNPKCFIGPCPSLL